MLTKKEKLISHLDKLPLDAVRDAWISRVRVEHERLDALESSLIESGMERVESDGLLTEDGREVMRVRGRAYALRPGIHAERLARAAVSAQNRVTATRTPKEPAATESLAAATCPQMTGGKPCGGALNRKPVCPSCITGKMGYKYRYTCESCGFDIVTKTELQK